MSVKCDIKCNNNESNSKIIHFTVTYWIHTFCESQIAALEAVQMMTEDTRDFNSPC